MYYLKKNMKNRILASLLAIIMVFTIVAPVSITYAEEVNEEKTSYVQEDPTVESLDADDSLPEGFEVMDVNVASGGGITNPEGPTVWILSANDLEVKKYDTPYGTGKFTITSAVEVDENSKTAEDGKSFEKRIKLGGAGDANTRSVKFSVGEEATVKVYAMSSTEATDRTLRLYKSDKTVLGSMNAYGAKLTKYEFQITEAGEYYLASSSGGVNIYEVIVTFGGSIEEPKRSDWNLVIDPEIKKIEPKDSKIIVTFELVTGVDGADKAIVVMMNEAGEEVANTIVGSDSTKSTRTAEFTPSTSGNYKFKVIAERDGEDKIKESSVSDILSYKLPLVTPSNLTATSIGEGSVKVSWGAVKEAESYLVLYKEKGAASFDNQSIVTKNEATLEGLTVGTAYIIAVKAVRGSEETATSLECEVTVTKEAQRAWSFAAWGLSAKKENNTYEVDANSGSVTIESKSESGKLQPVATDGLAFYYTKIDPEKENFVLSAKLTVDGWFMSGGQSGFGLMAADAVGSHGNTAEFYNNSYMATASKVEYFWDNENETVSDAGDKITMKNGIGAQEKIGITVENIADGTAGKSIKSTMFPLETSCANKGTGTYNVIGNSTKDSSLVGELYETELITTLNLKIQRDNTGYRISYQDENGNTSTKLYYDIDRTALTQIDKDNIYVGFYASRSAKITVSDIQLTITDPATDDPAEDRETTYVTPSYKVISTKDTGNASYDLVYLGNADGILTIKDSKGNAIANEEVVKANSTIKKNVVLSKGVNTFTINFTPDKDYIPGEHQKLSNYEPATFTHTVTLKNYDRKLLYVTPDGRDGGDGSKSNPLDIYTAVKYVTPGQKIVLAGGTYSMNSPLTVARGVDGAKNAMIYMIADPESKSRPVFDFNKKVAGMVLAGNYWYFQGFDVTNTADVQKGIQLSGSYCTLDNIETYRNGNTGVQLARYLTSDNFEDWPANNLILNCTSYENVDKGYADADGFAAKITTGNGNVFDGCIAYNNADDGWDLFAKPETGSIGKVVIKNSVAYRNGYLKDRTEAGNGNGFKMGGNSLAGHHELFNSVSFDNLAKGIESNSCPDIQVFNSTTFNNGSYNVAFYTTSAKNTDFLADGIISFRTKGANIDENLKPEGSQDKSKIYGTSNYYWIGGKSTNTDKIEVSSDWFVTLDTETVITRNQDGTINMNGLLELTDKAPADAGARMSGTPSRVIKLEDETVPPQPTQIPETPVPTATPAPTTTPTPTPELTKEEILEHLTPKRTGSLYVGGNSSNLGWFGLKLPNNVVKVTNFDKETLGKLEEGLVPITITYKSNKPGIITVKQNGRLIAKESGVAIITATVTMQDGTKEVYTRKLSVKKATVEFVESTVRMKVGEEAVFEIKVNGLDEDSIIWMSSKKDGAVVKKNPGSTTATVKAVSPETDWIYVIVDGVKKSMKVIIEE